MESFTVSMGLLGGGLAIFGGLCAVVVPMLLLAGLGYLLYRRNQQAKVARDAAQSWPHTSGTVVGSRVEICTSGRSTSHYPAVAYEHKVDRTKFHSKTIKAGDEFMSVRIMNEAQATVDRYPVGKRVTVYYNPANPKEAALER